LVGNCLINLIWFTDFLLSFCFMLLQDNILQHLLSIPSCKAEMLLLSTAHTSSSFRCEHPQCRSRAAGCVHVMQPVVSAGDSSAGSSPLCLAAV